MDGDLRTQRRNEMMDKYERALFEICGALRFSLETEPSEMLESIHSRNGDGAEARLTEVLERRIDAQEKKLDKQVQVFRTINRILGEILTTDCGDPHCVRRNGREYRG